jgi:hypothetical protein
MQLDRLLSRIRSALQDYASEFEQRALAAEYAEICARAALRLEQMVPLIRTGQDYAALQIAEAPPPVLDLVRQLSFAEAESWRAFCQRRALPVALPFDERNVDLVNQLYGKKIGETHPLYRDYRAAIRLRDEQQALRVLQSIRRVNPDDATAQSEYTRVARKLYERKSAELAAALDAHDTPRVLSLMESIIADGSVGNEFDPVWQRALTLRQSQEIAAARDRCLALAEQLRQLHEAGQWQETLSLLAEWDSLHGQFQLNLPPELETASAAIHEWAAALLATRQREEESSRRWKELATRLDELSREKPRALSNKTLAARIDELSDRVAALAAAEVVPPPELAAELESRLAFLRRAAGRRRVTRIVFATTAAVVLILAALAITWHHARQRQLEAQAGKLQVLLQQQAYAPLSDEVSLIDNKYPDLTNDPVVAPLLAKARSFLASQKAVRADFASELAQITQSAGPGATPAQLSSLLDALDALEKRVNSELGPESAADLHATLADQRVRLTQQLTRLQEQRAAQLTDIANRADQFFADKLTQPAPAETIQAALPQVRAILAEADTIPLDPAHATDAESAARARLAAQADKLKTLVAAAIDAATARVQLDQARSLEDYRAPVERLAANPLTGDPTVAAAHALFDHQSDWTTAAQNILLPADPKMWDFLATLNDVRLQPADDAQNEDIAFSRLATNDVLGNIYRANLVTYQDGVPHTSTTVFLAGNYTEEDNSTPALDEILLTGNIINRDGTTTPRDTRRYQFTNQPIKGDIFTNAQLAPESALVKRLHQAYDTRSGGIREPLLRVLDDVRTDPASSPILKAYLQQELLKIMQDRPYDWGLAFSPSAQADARELTAITGGDLQPADWLFPDNPRLPDDLRAFYARTASHHYYAEAAQSLQNFLQLRAIPILFAGHVDLDQHPVLVAAPPAAANLWGLDATGLWRPLFKISAGQPIPAPDAPAPARLTPLLYTK